MIERPPLPDQVCHCGCGQIFQPKRRGQLFVNVAHRRDWHNQERSRLLREARAMEAQREGAA